MLLAVSAGSPCDRTAAPAIAPPPAIHVLGRAGADPPHRPSIVARLRRAEALDVGDMLPSVPGIDGEVMQLGAGRFHGRVTEIHSGRLGFGEATWTPGLWLCGTLSAGLVALGFADGARGPAFFQRAALEPGELMMIRGGEGFDLKTLGPAGLVGMVAPAPLVSRHASALLGITLEELCLDCRLPSSADMLSMFCAPTLRGLAASIPDNQNVTLHPRARDTLEATVLDTLIGAIAAPRSRVCAPRRQQIARRAEEYLRAHVSEPVSLLELCEATNASERTLHLAFVESFGMPPKRLLKTLRLNRVRQALQRPTPSTTVTVAALEWGFFHLGRFSIDYREMFAESPVETLRRHSGGRSGQDRAHVTPGHLDAAA